MSQFLDSFVIKYILRRKQLQDEHMATRRALRYNVKTVGLLGHQSSGRRTLQKQVNKLFGKNKLNVKNSYQQYVKWIHWNLLLGMYQLSEATSTQFNFIFMKKESDQYMERIYKEYEYLTNSRTLPHDYRLPSQCVEAINELWKGEPAIQQTYLRRHLIQDFLPNYYYFVTNLAKFTDSSYVATFNDVLRLRIDVWGSNNNTALIKHSFFHEMDGKFRLIVPSKTQWGRYIFSLDIVFYVINVCSYSQYDKNGNNVFERSLIELRALHQLNPKIPFFIILTHLDQFDRVSRTCEFQEKLFRPPLYSMDQSYRVHYLYSDRFFVDPIPETEQHLPMKTNFHQLPPDCLVRISQFLVNKSLITLSMTCRQCHEILSADNIWKPRCLQLNEYLTDYKVKKKFEQECCPQQKFAHWLNRDSIPTPPKQHPWKTYFLENGYSKQHYLSQIEKRVRDQFLEKPDILKGLVVINTLDERSIRSHIGRLFMNIMNQDVSEVR